MTKAKAGATAEAAIGTTNRTTNGTAHGTTKARPRADAPVGARPDAIAATAVPAPDAAPRQQMLRFRTENLKSSYCNMANVTSTREEVVMNFGINQSWDQPVGTPDALAVDIQHRVILSPFAEKRLSDALVQLVRDYEQRYGPLA